MEYGFLSIVPPLIAISLAAAFKNVFLSLILGLYSLFVITSAGDFFGSIDTTVTSLFQVFGDEFSVMTFFDMILISGLMLLIEEAGGISGFIEIVTDKSRLITSKKGANIFTWLVGIAVFFSDSLSCLITGAITRTVNESFHISKEKMAYIIHSTATAVCLIIPLGGWGAFCAGLLSSEGVDNANAVLFQSIPFNFFNLLVVASIPILAVIGKDFGPMRKAERREAERALEAEKNCAPSEENGVFNLKAMKHHTSAKNLIIPIVSLIVIIITGIFVTGKGDFFAGDGVKALLYANILTLLLSTAMYMKQGIFTLKEAADIITRGCGRILPTVLILVLAFTLGHYLTEIGTALYVSSLFTSSITPGLFPMMVFLMGGVISFATGSSMGTMAMVAPIAIPTAMGLGLSIPLTASAIWGGATFGDQSSPISDTTFLTCSTIGCKPMEHIGTQLPYTLFIGTIACILYVAFGLIL